MATSLSIIIPIYNEAENIVPLTNAIEKNCPVDYELIFINDGSKDDSLPTIIQLANTNKNIKCISLSRNFGHQHALMAGLEHATGNNIIIMDGDGQHPPELIPSLLDLLNQGYDLVHTERKKTAHSGFLKKISSALFYRFINLISDTKIVANQADFKAFNQKVLKAVLSFKERELFLRGLFSWIGFRTTSYAFDAPARWHGKSKYSYTKMLQLALKGTTSFSFKPLRMALLIGSLVSLAAFAFGIYALIAYFNGNTVPGWASIIIAVMFLGGTQLLAIGLLGEYIASLFTESKQRPIYLIDQKINID